MQREECLKFPLTYPTTRKWKMWRSFRMFHKDFIDVKKTIKKDALFHNLKSYFVVRRCLPLCDKKSLLWVRHRCGHFPIRTFWLTNNSMKFFLQAEKTIACTFFITDFRFAETVFAIFLTKIFFAFSVRTGSTEKNGSQRQKLLPKIHIISCRQRNNFSAVSLTSVLSAPHKSAKNFLRACFPVAEKAK